MISMSKQSDYLREQADRAERLARTVSDEGASKALSELSKEYRLRAQQSDERQSDSRKA
jgi:hypothetical protein